MVLLLSLCTLASGSTGNAALIFNETSSLLIDAGISAKRITEGLAQVGLTPAGLDGICITHAHSDHIAGLRVLMKRTQAPLYMTQATAEELLRQFPGLEPKIHVIFPEETIEIGNFFVKNFSTPHDIAGSVGYTISDGERKCAVVTDLGYAADSVLRNILGAHLALVEANHDVEWLMSGPYPPYLKKRILSDHGHLSNEASGELCCLLAEHGAEKLILGHLSPENNTPARALSTVQAILKGRGLEHVSVTVAAQKSCCPPIEV